MMKSKLGALTVFAVLGCGLAADALSQTMAQATNPSAAQRINQRKGVMEVQSKLMNRLLVLTDSKTPYDAAAAQRWADLLAQVTTLAWEDFVPATAGNAATRAKDDLYKDPAKFKEYADKLQAETRNLASVARNGNQATVFGAFKNVAMVCNTCHEAYSGYPARFRLE